MAFKKTLKSIVLGAALFTQSLGCTPSSTELPTLDGRTPDAAVVDSAVKKDNTTPDSRIDTRKADSTVDAGVDLRQDTQQYDASIDSRAPDAGVDSTFPDSSIDTMPDLTQADGQISDSTLSDFKPNPQCGFGLYFTNEDVFSYELADLVVQTNGTVNKGTAQVHNKETTNFSIKPGDYLIVSKLIAPSYPLTRVLRYDSLNPLNRTVQFTDMSWPGSSQTETYSVAGSDISGTINLNGAAVKFAASNETTQAQLKVDLNGDGTYSTAEVKLYPFGNNNGDTLANLLRCKKSSDPTMRYCPQQNPPAGWLFDNNYADEGSTHSYTIGNKNYSVTVLNVDDPTGKATLQVNNETTQPLGPCEKAVLSDGTFIYVKDTIVVHAPSAVPNKDAIVFYLGK